MNAPATSGLRDWILPAGWAVGGSLVVLLLFRAPALPGADVNTPRAGGREIVRIQSGSPEAAVSDPTYLFLPSRFSTRTGAAPAEIATEQGLVFGPVAAKLTLAENDGKIAFPPVAALPETSVDAMALASPAPPFPGMGRVEKALPVLPSRDASVEVVSIRNGERVLAEEIRNAHPPGGAEWRPLQIMVQVEPAGLMWPTIESKSGIEIVDNFFLNYLAKGMHLGERLAPGIYRVTIGP